MGEDDIPKDYQYVDWEHLANHVGRVILGRHVPVMTRKVAQYLTKRQAAVLRRAADALGSRSTSNDRVNGGEEE